MLLMLVVAVQLIGCISTRGQKMKIEDLSGMYILEIGSKYQALSDDKNYSSLELHKNGIYTLKKAEISFTPVIEQCDYASKGKWSVLSNDVLELTSEDEYLKQKGFEYVLKKENKLSQDSLYIKVNFPNDYEPNVKVNFTFNHNVSKSIDTEKTLIVIPKSKHLLAKSSNSVNRNHIDFSINANVSGIHLYKSRVLFKIFEEDIDTENTNYLTVTLPNFDRCFFEFEPYNQELIYIKGKNQLLWQGEIWKR